MFQANVHCEFIIMLLRSNTLWKICRIMGSLERFSRFCCHQPTNLVLSLTPFEEKAPEAMGLGILTVSVLYIEHSQWQQQIDPQLSESKTCKNFVGGWCMFQESEPVSNGKAWALPYPFWGDTWLFWGRLSPAALLQGEHNDNVAKIDPLRMRLTFRWLLASPKKKTCVPCDELWAASRVAFWVKCRSCQHHSRQRAPPKWKERWRLVSVLFDCDQGFRMKHTQGFSGVGQFVASSIHWNLQQNSIRWYCTRTTNQDGRFHILFQKSAAGRANTNALAGFHTTSLCCQDDENEEVKQDNEESTGKLPEEYTVTDLETSLKYMKSKGNC